MFWPSQQLLLLHSLFACSLLLCALWYCCVGGLINFFVVQVADGGVVVSAECEVQIITFVDDERATNVLLYTHSLTDALTHANSFTKPKILLSLSGDSSFLFWSKVQFRTTHLDHTLGDELRKIGLHENQKKKKNKQTTQEKKYFSFLKNRTDKVGECVRVRERRTVCYC